MRQKRSCLTASWWLERRNVEAGAYPGPGMAKIRERRSQRYSEDKMHTAGGP